MSARRLFLLAAFAAVLAAVVWWRLDGKAEPTREHGPTAVTLIKARSGAAPVQLAAMGTVLSPHTVNVRAQVSGTLKEIYFSEGDNLAAGQRLFLIDPAPYAAAVAQARAQLALDRAAAAAARAQYERMKPLAAQEFVTSQEFDDARAASDEAAARVLADTAALQAAEIELGHTLIRAPIAGRSGAVAAKAGNLVSSGDATALVVINQIERMEVRFAVPQARFADVQAALGRGPLPVEVGRDATGKPLARGVLSFVDNSVDTTTGTVAMKAEVDNPEQRLWPGAFVAVTATLRVEPQAVLIPESAVQPGADGPFVFVVDAEQRAQLRNVVVDRQFGDEVVISAGLAAGESIVAKAPHNLHPGSPVRDAAQTGGGTRTQPR